jgi:transcriptional regulator with XRE-family HTH domain
MHTASMTANHEDARDLHDDTSTQRQRPIPADTLMIRLAIARMHAGHLTIREAAERCGLNYASWSNWEQGSRPRDLLGVAHAVSEGLDVDHDWILFGGRLAGPRGMPTERRKPLPREYQQATRRPRPGRPKNRPTPDRGNTRPPRPEQRRPVRISQPSAA